METEITKELIIGALPGLGAVMFVLSITSMFTYGIYKVTHNILIVALFAIACLGLALGVFFRV